MYWNPSPPYKFVSPKSALSLYQSMYLVYASGRNIVLSGNIVACCRCLSINRIAGEAEDPDTPCVITLPSTFRLERTNFVASSPFIAILSIHTLLAALRSSLAEAKVDVLEFKPAHCVVSRLFSFVCI